MAQPNAFSRLLEGLTGSPLVESLRDVDGSSSKKSFSINSDVRKRQFEKFLQAGNVNKVVGAVETRPLLDAGVYQVSLDMKGEAIFERKAIRSDEILRFPDSRYNAITTEIDRFWSLAENFKDLGLAHKRGVLLWGLPGCGKTCLIKQVVEDCVNDGHVVFYAKSLHGLAEVLQQYRDVEPTRQVLVVLEDVDEMVQYNERAFLELFDGDDQVSGVLYLATTNYKERLPARVMRSGRLDVKVEVKNPPREGRLAYFRHKLPKLSEEEIDRIADLTEDFSFGQLREFIVAAYALKQNPKEAISRIRRNFTESANPDLGELLTEDDQGASGWASTVARSPQATIYKYLNVGDRFKFRPTDSDTHTKGKRGYTDPKGRRFSTGSRTAVVKVESLLEELLSESPLIMSKKDYARHPKDYKTKIKGVPHLLTLDKKTGATVLSPVTLSETFKDTKAAINALGMHVRKTGEGPELRVAHGPGEEHEPAAYYTDDEQDAKDTARLMARYGNMDKKESLLEAFDKLSTGARVRVSDLSGLDSGKTGKVVHPSEVGTNPRGVLNIPGEYKPFDRDRSHVVKLDKGGYISMPKGRLQQLTAEARRLIEANYSIYDAEGQQIGAASAPNEESLRRIGQGLIPRGAVIVREADVEIEELNESDFEVVVGNLGTVLKTTSPVEARKTFDAYVASSKLDYARESGEDVYLMRDGEVFDEYQGTAGDEENEGMNESRSLDDVANHHMTKIAKATLRMHDAIANMLGGMTKGDARAHLKKMGWSDKKIEKHALGESVELNEAKAEFSTCPTCGDKVRVPEAPIRKTGFMRCGNGHLFQCKDNYRVLDRGKKSESAEPKRVAEGFTAAARLEAERILTEDHVNNADLFESGGFEDFFDAYVEAALWSTTDDSDPNTGGEPLDKNYGMSDIDSSSLAKMRADCQRFFDENYDLISNDILGAGHDFWLTRNGHGAGFWDGDWEHGDELTQKAHAFGESDLIVGDDGKIHAESVQTEAEHTGVELHYSSGGHGGPYPDMDSAKAAAKRLMRGRPAEHHIDIRPSSTSKEIETLHRVYRSDLATPQAPALKGMSPLGLKSEKIGPIKQGALHAQLGIKQGEKIGKAGLLKAKRSDDPEERKRATFALNMNYEERSRLGKLVDKAMAAIVGEAKLVRGDKLHPDLQKQVLTNYVHRHLNPKYKGASHADIDSDFLKTHSFAVTKGGQLHQGRRWAQPDFMAHDHKDEAINEERQTRLTRKDKVGVGDYDSIKWAFDTHLEKPDTGEYNSAVLYGNEDDPSKIDFFRSENPDYTDQPDFSWPAENESINEADVSIANHGSIVLITPLTPEAEDWIEQNIGSGDEIQYVGKAVVAEPRYVADIISGMQADGLTVESAKPKKRAKQIVEGSDFWAFFDAYLEAALWSSSDDAGEPLFRNHTTQDIDSSSLSKMRADAQKFYDDNYEMISQNVEGAGHDFWLTRNGHGAGFWDGDWDEHGDILTKASEAFGEQDIYVGDDGKLFIHP